MGLFDNLNLTGSPRVARRTPIVFDLIVGVAHNGEDDDYQTSCRNDPYVILGLKLVYPESAPLITKVDPLTQSEYVGTADGSPTDLECIEEEIANSSLADFCEALGADKLDPGVHAIRGSLSWSCNPATPDHGEEWDVDLEALKIVPLWIGGLDMAQIVLGPVE